MKSGYLLLEDVADERGENPAKVARLLTLNQYKFYLYFDETEEYRLAITERETSKGYYSMYQVPPGYYPLTLEAQHEYVKNLFDNNFNLHGLRFMDSGEEIRLSSLDDQDRSISVVVKKADIKDLAPPLPAYQDGAVTGSPTTPEDIFFENPGKNKSRTKNGNRAKHTLIIWDALQDCDEKLKSEAKPTQIWTFLRHNVDEYNNEQIIIKITHD
ncbi:hypothetical protein HOE67_02840, partial [Candidatus Peregrinibacteria bacterium]|nr:hypothetical protein [Candidatus Peregrinibacteria bacterium]